MILDMMLLSDLFCLPPFFSCYFDEVDCHHWVLEISQSSLLFYLSQNWKSSLFPLRNNKLMDALLKALAAITLVSTMCGAK